MPGVLIWIANYSPPRQDTLWVPCYMRPTYYRSILLMSSRPLVPLVLALPLRALVPIRATLVATLVLLVQEVPLLRVRAVLVLQQEVPLVQEVLTLRVQAVPLPRAQAVLTLLVRVQAVITLLVQVQEVLTLRVREVLTPQVQEVLTLRVQEVLTLRVLEVLTPQVQEVLTPRVREVLTPRVQEVLTLRVLVRLWSPQVRVRVRFQVPEERPQKARPRLALCPNSVLLFLLSRSLHLSFCKPTKHSKCICLYDKFY